MNFNNLILILLLFLSCSFSLVKTDSFFKYSLIQSVNETVEPKFCRYRNYFVSVGIYPVLVDWGCYDFNRDGLFTGGKLKLNCIKNTKYPCTIINNSEVVFHHSLPAIKNAVLKSFGNQQQYVDRWLRCCEDAGDCCENHNMATKEEEGKCPPVWDGWTCFTESREPDEVEESECSPYAYTGKAPRCTHFSYKTCLDNGVWNDQTDYSTCDITPRLKTRTVWHISMLSISLIVCAPAILILCSYEQLRKTKYYLIRNLILIIMIRNAIVLMTKQMIVLDELTTVGDTVMTNNNWACKVLTFFEKLSSNAVFTCMLLEGFYLHQLLTNIFGSRQQAGPKMLFYYIGGAAISIITAVVWSILIAINYDSNCWIITDDNSYHWINVAPRLIMLILNTFLLLHIVWVLFKTFKTKSKSDDTNPAFRTAKSSLICVPLFGFPILFIVVRPDTDSCTWEQVYYFVSFAMEGLQGVGVAILHCYIDREVLRLLRKTFQPIFDRINCCCCKTEGGDGKRDRLSKWDDRRTTATTCTDPVGNQYNEGVSLSYVNSPVIIPSPVLENNNNQHFINNGFDSTDEHHEEHITNTPYPILHEMDGEQLFDSFYPKNGIEPNHQLHSKENIQTDSDGYQPVYFVPTLEITNSSSYQTPTNNNNDYILKNPYQYSENNNENYYSDEENDENLNDVDYNQNSHGNNTEFDPNDLETASTLYEKPDYFDSENIQNLDRPEPECTEKSYNFVIPLENTDEYENPSNSQKKELRNFGEDSLIEKEINHPNLETGTQIIGNEIYIDPEDIDLEDIDLESIDPEDIDRMNNELTGNTHYTNWLEHRNLDEDDFVGNEINVPHLIEIPKKSGSNYPDEYFTFNHRNDIETVDPDPDIEQMNNEIINNSNSQPYLVQNYESGFEPNVNFENLPVADISDTDEDLQNFDETDDDIIIDPIILFRNRSEGAVILNPNDVMQNYDEPNENIVTDPKLTLRNGCQDAVILGSEQENHSVPLADVQKKVMFTMEL